MYICSQSDVRNAVVDLLETAKEKLGVVIDLNNVEIKFDLKGTVAGTCITHKEQKKLVLNFNKTLMSENPMDYFYTVVHEVAHGVAHIKYHPYDITPHGKHWKYVVSVLGGIPKRCHAYSVDTIKSTKPYFLYRCNCMEHKLSPIIHKRMQNGQNRFCSKCKARVFLVTTL